MRRLAELPLGFLVALVRFLDLLGEFRDLLAALVGELAQVFRGLFLFFELGLESGNLLANLALL